VNKHGRHLGDEAAVYATFSHSFEQRDSGLEEYRNVPAYFICDSTCTTYYTFPGAKAPGEIPERVVSADTLEELTDKLAIDKAGLVEEMTAFNANAVNGIDPVWHRGEFAIDMTTSNLYQNYRGPERTDLKNPALAPVAVGPFYGAMYGPGTCGTNGGLRINKDAQVGRPGPARERRPDTRPLCRRQLRDERFRGRLRARPHDGRFRRGHVLADGPSSYGPDGMTMKGESVTLRGR